MAAFQVESSTVKASTCPDCGGDTGAVTGFAYRDGDAHGIYYVDWCERHDADPPRAYMTIALGDWGADAPASERLAFGIHVRPDGMQVADYPHRDNPDFLGPFVEREKALALDLNEFWELADHIVLSDPNAATVLAWVQGEQESALAQLHVEQPEA